MSTTVTMEEAQAKLPELVARLAGGEEIVITQDQKPVAKLIRERPLDAVFQKAADDVFNRHEELLRRLA